MSLELRHKREPRTVAAAPQFPLKCRRPKCFVHDLDATPSRGSANDPHGVPSPAVLALTSPLPSQAARPSSDYCAADYGAAPMNHKAAQPRPVAAIRPVASQPSHSTGPDTVKRPITL